MAETKTTKKTATKKAAAPKAEKEVKAAAPKKCATKKVAAPKAEKATTVAVTVENVGFKAGDVYQTLSKAAKALSIAEVAKQAGIATDEVLLGIGWLMKEGKVKGDNGNVVLA